MRKRMVIIGAGSHGRVVMDMALLTPDFDVVGILDTVLTPGAEVNGIRVIGKQNELISLMKKHDFNSGIVCVGDNYAREKVVQEILEMVPDFDFVNVLHPSVVLSPSAKLGTGNALMANVVVNPNAEIGNHCIVNTASSVEHNCRLMDYSSISAGVTMGGYVEIGRYAAIALGVTLFDRIKIGENTVVGSGSLVSKDLESHVLAYGIPAKIIRERKPGEKFLK